MFRTSFSKYLAAFIIIIFISFAILAGIVTSMVRNYAFSDTEDRLSKISSIVADVMNDDGVTSIEDEIYNIEQVTESLVNIGSDYDLIITDSAGKILLSTAHQGAVDEDGNKTPIVDVENGLGTIGIKQFKKEVVNDSDINYVYNGNISGVSKDQYMVSAREITDGDEIKGYVMALASTTKENNIVVMTRKAVIDSSIWVMLAAVIVAYFITERIVHPLRNMTSAAKKFAKGDFSARISVSGRNDEVAELGNAFNNMADSLERLDKMRNSFLANVSHDLRTPMTTISGFIDGINSGAIPPEKHEYYLGIISAEVHRLSRLVSELLDVSRLESGERKFDYIDFDVTEVARLILISFEQKIEAKRLEVEFDAENDVMYAHADKDAIYQVLYNLCHNAIKFAKDGGKFRISIKRITDTKLKISVFDEGQSISEEDRKMVFDRFYKTDESRGLDKTGVGLGLYISKTIIDAHGETIGVDSVGDSCEFWFTLTEGTQLLKRTMTLDIPK